MIASVRRRNVERLCDKYSIGPDLRQSEPTAAALFHVRTDHLNLGGLEGRRPSKQSFFFRALEERTLFQSAKKDGCEGGFPALALPRDRDARSHDGCGCEGGFPALALPRDRDARSHDGCGCEGGFPALALPRDRDARSHDGCGCEGGFPALALPRDRDARSHDGQLLKNERALGVWLLCTVYVS